jgi:hypothetical protein
MATSISEALTAAYDEHQAKQSSIGNDEATRSTVSAPLEESTPAPEVAATPEKPSSAERARDGHGRFVANDGKSADGKSADGKPADEKPAEVAQSVPAVAESPKPRHTLERPSSWKKEMWEHWGQLDPAVAAYMREREEQYARGVSTYKQEWDNAKPLLDAIAPFRPLLDQHGIKADHWIANLGNAHRTLALGNGQEKLQAFARLAQDYGVPLQALWDQNAAQEFVQRSMYQPRMQPLTPQQAQPQEDYRALVRQEIMAERVNSEISAFASATGSDGKPLYPHYETVKDDMALLLEAGKAQDLKSAYDKALRMHDDIWDATQAQRMKADEAARLDANRKAVAAAKASSVSVKSATPTTAGGTPKKGIGDTLSDAWDTHMTSRV